MLCNIHLFKYICCFTHIKHHCVQLEVEKEKSQILAVQLFELKLRGLTTLIKLVNDDDDDTFLDSFASKQGTKNIKSWYSVISLFRRHGPVLCDQFI